MQHLLSFVEDNLQDKPITYFLNGAETICKWSNIVSGFDSFIYEISYNSSWSGGVGCWKSDFNTLMESGDILKYNGLFPHLAFVFMPYEDRMYLVDKKKLFDEISYNATKKGNYDLFRAFGLEYLEAVKSLLSEKVIESDTYSHVKDDNQKFIENLYAEYVVLHKKCSYNLSSAKVSLNQYYTFDEIKKRARRIAIDRAIVNGKKVIGGNSR